MTHAIITGGSSGIGLEIARHLLSKGYAVTLIASRAEGLFAAQQDLSSCPKTDPKRIHSGLCDVRDNEALTDVIAQAERVLGPCTMLVTSAGVAQPGYFDALDPGAFQRQMDVNCIGTMNAVRAIYPGMVERGAGQIGMISSAAGIVGVFGYTAYTPSKFAVRGFAEALRMEARPKGISVSVCYPPDTDTPQFAAEQEHLPAETKAIAGTVKPWRAEDVACVAVDGILKGRFAVYPGFELKALGRLCSLIHPLLDRYFAMIIDRVKSAR